MNKKNQHALLPIIIMMSVIGLMATDIYIPVMPSIAADFNISSHIMQFTLGGYLLGLSIAQLIYGPLSEHCGRKPVLLTGMILFTLATLACSVSTSGGALILFRFLQGVGACAGLTIGRAIVGDLYSKKEAARVFATVFPFVGLSPAIAPVIGSTMHNLLGWHSVFGLLFFLGLILCFLISFKLPETKNKNLRINFNMKSVSETYASIISQKIFWGYTLIPCFAYIAYFSYISESSFVFSSHGYSSSQIGYFYIALSLSYLAGNLLSKRLLDKMSLNTALLLGYLIFIVGALSMLAANMTGPFYAIKIWLPMALLTLGNGFLLPLGTAGVVGHFKDKAGYASALLGFLQLGTASCASLLVGVLSQAQALYLAWYLSVCCVVGFLFFVFFFSEDLAGRLALSGRQKS